jgi:hypothetical protein
MMTNPYDLHSWSKHYREDAKAEATTCHLARRDGGRSAPVPLLLAVLALAAILFGASACTDPASSSVDPDSYGSSGTTSESVSASGSASPSSTSEASTATASSADPSSASPDASASGSSSPSADTGASHYAGMRSTSMECYTFYSDGTVELRHGGTSTISDSGSYQGDGNFGEIVWGSGRWTSTVVAEGDGLIIDDLTVSPVTSCF